MKFLLVFLSFLSIIASVLGGDLEILELCGTECILLQKCVATVFANQSKIQVTLYPPKGEFGLCNCQDTSQYYNCLKCYNTKKNKNQYVEQVLINHCDILKESMENTNSTAPNPETNTNGDNNDAGNGNNTDKQEKNSGNTTKIGLIVVGSVAVIGVVGFLFYTRKQKQRPESMPFFGNGASTPHTYATLNSVKDVNDTNDYNNQYYNNTDNNQYTYTFEPNQDFTEYEPNYQYGNQYTENNYENNQNVADTNIAINGETQGVEPVQATANYESRRESMIPGTQPTTTNISGAYVCAYKYDPQLDDELALHVDDKVQIIEEYEDGWMKAINLTTGKEGMAPKVCVKEA